MASLSVKTVYGSAVWQSSAEWNDNLQYQLVVPDVRVVCWIGLRRDNIDRIIVRNIAGGITVFPLDPPVPVACIEDVKLQAITLLAEAGVVDPIDYLRVTES